VREPVPTGAAEMDGRTGYHSRDRSSSAVRSTALPRTVRDEKPPLVVARNLYTVHHISLSCYVFPSRSERARGKVA
jgi:hypothetical protein